MPLLVPIVIFSAVILFWIYFVTSLVIGLFGIFMDILIPAIIVSLIGGMFFVIGIIGANMRYDRRFQIMYMIGAIWLGAVTIAGMIGMILLVIAELLEISYTGYIPAAMFVGVTLLLNLW
jgi:hypothetical protein